MDELFRIQEIGLSLSPVIPLDVNSDGRIELSELKHLLSASQIQVPLNDRQVQRLLLEADIDHEKSLDFYEFSLLATSKGAQNSRFRRGLYTIAGTVVANNELPAVNSYLDSYNCCPPPVFIPLISIVQIAVFVYYYLNDEHDIGLMNGCAGCWTHTGVGPLLFAPPYRKQAWRFLSYMFLHAGLGHLVGNMVFQVLLGIPLELVHKCWRIAPIYLLAVLLGSLLQYVLDPSVYLVGASAGVYALVTAHLANVILNWSEMPYRWPRLGVILAFLTLDIGYAVYRRVFADVCENVSYMAHIAGALTGILMGFALLINLRILKWEKILMWISLALYAIVFVFCVVMAVVLEPTSKALWSTRCTTPDVIDVKSEL